MGNTPTPSQKQGPCQDEFDGYMKCVNAKPDGLKQDDCEPERLLFQKCMVEWKNSRQQGAAESEKK
eukprot:CAMPEP_0204278306 /NCGR_PEP_ID=MMETSP0468-20130131/29792_1 /ASSEMBLY_ACC=CAM_ASM_000383 /TAXON_ID=2969 /ORGANISM="Oxyrrhis marina" /LENGTH=65 /DNA_ID=CAMNT_0051255191 /DNA_START=12 /DNA_END=209 /DNA_ORIENTATION=+